MCLINNILTSHGFTLFDFSLPDLQNTQVFEDDNTVGNQISSNINEKILTLTDNQRIFNTVSNEINEKCNGQCIFIDGPGGSGKS